TKYIFVTGGVVSSLGKGIAAASLGRLLVERGLRVTIQKFDPYINVDPGTMSPFQHGEVYVTDDGAETDLDLGHYERFIDRSLSQVNNVRRSGATTRCSFTSPSFPTSPRPPSSRPSRPSTPCGSSCRSGSSPTSWCAAPSGRCRRRSSARSPCFATWISVVWPRARTCAR